MAGQISGSWLDSTPIWARGKYGINYLESSNNEFQILIKTFQDYESRMNAEKLDIGEVPENEINYSVNSMSDKTRICIISEDGSEKVLDVIFAFELKDNKNEYVIYTENEKDRSGNILPTVSMINRVGKMPVLLDVPDKDLPRVKDVLKEMAKDDDKIEKEQIATNISIDEESERQVMTILSDDGSEEKVEVVLAFEFKDTLKEYVVYTKNEKDHMDNTTVYVSNVER